MRRGFGFVGLLVTVILFIVVGAIAYNVGWSDGVNTHLPAVTQGDGAPANYYGPHYWGGPGFGFFGIFWFLLILFGIFWLFRLAFFGFAGRRMMGGGWGPGRGWGYGPGSGGFGRFEEKAQEWHRRQHGEQPPSSGGTPPPPPSETRSV
jgi:hypothetical protein